MSVNLIFFGKSVDEEFISLAFNMKIVINFVSGKVLRFDHFSVRKSVQYSISIEQIFFNHRMGPNIERFPLLNFLYN